MSPPLPLSRREALRRIIAVTALAGTARLFGATGEAAPVIGWDPDLLKKEIPWPRVLTAAEKQAVTVLADLILPADEFGPAASAVGVPDFLDEWVSAPYEQQVRDLKIIREGLGWLNRQGQQRHQVDFAACKPEQQTALLEAITTEGKPERKEGRAFFLLFRDRAMGGYFSTPQGWKALGYTGNTPLAEFPGPPPEALAHLGLA